MSQSSMDSHLFYRLQFLLYQLAFAVCLVSVCRGDIEVTVSSKGAVEGTRVTLSCEYNIVSPASFFSLLWLKLTDDGTTNIAYYRSSVTYYGNYTSGYEMSTDNITTTGTNLTIFTVSERVDNGTYRCDLTVQDSGIKAYQGLGDLTVIQDPCTGNSAPCNNKGNCTIDGLGYSCECVEGYSGPTCETAATTTGIPETSTKLGVTSTEPSGDGTTTESSTGSTTSETSSFSTTEEKSLEPTTTDQPPDLSNTTNSATTTDGVLASSTAEELTTSDPGIDDPGAPGGLSGGVIAGIVIGAVAVVALVIGIGAFIHSKHPGTAVKPAVVDGSHNEPSNGDAVLRVKKKEDG